MKIFVTGLGIISAIGNGTEETLDSLKSNKSGISELSFLKTIHTGFPCGEIKADYQQLAQLAQVSTDLPLVRTPLLGIIAAKQAYEQAKLANVNKTQIAFVSGTTVGGMDRMEQFYDSFVHNDSCNHYLYPHNIGDSTQFIADKLGNFGFLTSISTACSSAANAILFGAKLILNKRADIVLAGGCESISKYHFNGFNTLKVLDNQICRPFDESRSGLNLGEGAGYIVLESEESATKRKVNPLCQLSGFANTCDAFHQTATSENGDGPYLAMIKAIEAAHLKPSDIDYINCHGTGTINNDITEGRAMERIFGIDNIPDFSSTKAFTGHTTSAAGGVESVITILSLINGFCPINLNFSQPMNELNIKPLTSNKTKNLNHVMTNSFGFGGNDTSLIFSKV